MIPQDENNYPAWIDREAWAFGAEERHESDMYKLERFTPLSTSEEDSEPAIITIPHKGDKS